MTTTTGDFLPPISLDWDAIHTVFLDMDGTLLDLHFDNHFWLEHLPVVKVIILLLLNLLQLN